MDDRKLEPFEDLYDGGDAAERSLPPALAGIYGRLRLPSPPDRPWVTSNFVSSLDGVVSLGAPGTGGDEISGGSREDRFVMGLLRATADVIVVGAGTLRAWPRHLWTPERICRPMAEEFRALRRAWGKTSPALTVVVTARGDVDLRWPVFTDDRAPAKVVTTPAGAARLEGSDGRVPVVVGGPGHSLSGPEILRSLALPAGSHVLLECGPALMGRFLKDRAVDELFLTLAPQVVGRDASTPRDAFVADAVFLPGDTRWSRLTSVKRCGSVLFLRYGFGSPLTRES